MQNHFRDQMNINVNQSSNSDSISTELEDLMHRASEKRDKRWGDIVTYSRKVFVPLTNMCRDTCGYCTFVKHPDSPEAKIMTPDEVLSVAKKESKKDARNFCSVWEKGLNSAMKSRRKCSIQLDMQK